MDDLAVRETVATTTGFRTIYEVLQQDLRENLSDRYLIPEGFTLHHFGESGVQANDGFLFQSIIVSESVLPRTQLRQVSVKIRA
mgnify:CR=1 FL=1